MKLYKCEVQILNEKKKSIGEVFNILKTFVFSRLKFGTGDTAKYVYF